MHLLISRLFALVFSALPCGGMHAICLLLTRCHGKSSPWRPTMLQFWRHYSICSRHVLLGRPLVHREPDTPPLLVSLTDAWTLSDALSSACHLVS